MAKKAAHSRSAAARPFRPASPQINHPAGTIGYSSNNIPTVNRGIPPRRIDTLALRVFPSSRPVPLLDWISMPARRLSALPLISLAPSLVPMISIALCLLLAPGHAQAQSAPKIEAQTESQSQTAPTAALTGIVTDPSGALVPSATVTLQQENQLPLTTATDAGGAFRFAPLPAGAFDLTIEASGFRTETRSNLRLQPGQTLRLKIGLTIDVQREQIAVSADQLDSSPDHSLGAIVLSPSDLEALATNPTDLQTQLQLIAGSDPTTPPELFVDGFTASRLPPKSSIREVRINQNPYSAQYDTIGLGRIEVFTRPGSDKLHGDLTLLGDDSSLNSSNPYVIGQPPYSAFYSEGAISGPLSRNSSWLLTGDRQDVGAQSFVYASTSTTGPTYTATVDSPQTSTDLGPRLDFQLGRIHTLSLRYQFGHQTQDNLLQSQLALPSQAIDTRHTDQTLQISDTQAWTEHAINETRFQFMRTNDSSVSLGGGPSVQVEGAFIGGGNAVNHLHDGQNHYEFQDYYSLLHGDHLLRLGARVRDISDNNTSSQGYNGVYIFSSLSAYEITTQGLAGGLTPAQIRAAGGGASFFTYALGTPKVEVSVADLGAYVEDEWKATPNTTIDAGLRYETQSRIRDHADFAPRLSWSWAIGATRDKPAKAVLRAGIGVFYQRFDSQYIVIADRENGVNQQQYVVNDPDFYPNVPNPDALGPDAQPSIYSISPRMHAPYIVQQGVSLDKDFFKRLSLSIDYSFYRGVDQFLVRNINAPLPGTYNPADPDSGIRPNGKLENIYQYESEGTSKRNRIYLNVHYRTRPVTLYGIYIFGYSNANTAGPSSFPSNQYDLHADYGRAANDLRQRAYFGALANLPWHFQLNPFLIVQSSQPFNITVGQDLNGDSLFNDRPAFATDLTRPSVYRTKWGNFDADPLPNQKIIPINYGTGPSLAMLQLAVSRNFAFGPKIVDPNAPATPEVKPGTKASREETARKFQMNLGIESQNILNTVNGGPPVGVLGAQLFGHSTSLSTTQFSNSQANRIIYLHMNVSF
jgi:hypothetical protein